MGDYLRTSYHKINLAFRLIGCIGKSSTAACLAMTGHGGAHSPVFGRQVTPYRVIPHGRWRSVALLSYTTDVAIAKQWGQKPTHILKIMPEWTKTLRFHAKSENFLVTRPFSWWEGNIFPHILPLKCALHIPILATPLCYTITSRRHSAISSCDDNALGVSGIITDSKWVRARCFDDARWCW